MFYRNPLRAESIESQLQQFASPTSGHLSERLQCVELGALAVRPDRGEEQETGRLPETGQGGLLSWKVILRRLK